MLWIDNLPSDSAFGFPALDAALTSAHFKDRILGISKTYDGPFRTVIVATGNNISVKGDAGRRVVPIRLDITEANPERRGGFMHADLEGWVRQNRSRILAATLVLLRATMQAGVRPSTSFGSYDGWNLVVRACVEHHWGADPLGGQADYRAHCDDDQDVLGQVIAALARLPRACTPSEILAFTVRDPRLREAVCAACPTRDGLLPSPEMLGHFLKQYVNRPSQELLCIRRERIGHGQFSWRVTVSFAPKGPSADAVEAFARAVFAHFGAGRFSPVDMSAVDGLRREVATALPGIRDDLVGRAMVTLLRLVAVDKWTVMEDGTGEMWSIAPARDAASRRADN
jgi:hypothetical protein